MLIKIFEFLTESFFKLVISILSFVYSCELLRFLFTSFLLLFDNRICYLSSYPLFQLEPTTDSLNWLTLLSIVIDTLPKSGCLLCLFRLLYSFSNCWMSFSNWSSSMVCLFVSWSKSGEKFDCLCRKLLTEPCLFYSSTFSISCWRSVESCAYLKLYYTLLLI